MTAEQVKGLLDQYLMDNDGKDYYAYTCDPHWYGTLDEMVDFANAVVDLWHFNNA